MKRAIRRDTRQIRVTEWIITILFILALVVLILLIGFVIGGAIAIKTGDTGVFENVSQLLFWICVSLFVVSISLVKLTEPAVPPNIFENRKEEPEQEVKQE